MTMLSYAILEISGKQYKVIPNQSFEVGYLGEEIKNIVASVLLLAQGGKIKLGNPYLEEKLSLKVVEHTRGEKVRVSKFHAKANYRRNTGFKSKLTKVIYGT